MSYSTLDKHLAGQVKNYFAAKAGFEVFLAHDDLQPSEEWIARIRSELKACKVFVPLITTNFRSSLWTDQEVGFAISRSKLKKERRCVVLPLVFSPVTLPPHGFLKDFQALPIPSAEPNELQTALRRAVSAICTKLDLEYLRREIAIKTFGESRSFAFAKRNADELLTMAPFSFQEAMHLASASVTNNQIYMPAELRQPVRRLLRDRMNELDPDLKAQFEQKFP